MKKGCLSCFVIIVPFLALLIIIGIPTPRRAGYLLDSDQKERAKQIKSMLADMKYIEPTQEGNAIVLLLDASGSMKEPAANAADRTPKIDIAKQTAKRILGEIRIFAEKNPGQNIRVGMSRFQDDAVRAVVALSSPLPGDVGYEQDIDMIVPNGSTPLGEAIIDAYRTLNATGFRHQHIIVITDGENTSGREPIDAVKVIRHLKQGTMPSVYFIAFDTAAAAFDDEKNAGAWVTEARDAAELNQTLDFIFYQKILAESIE